MAESESSAQSAPDVGVPASRDDVERSSAVSPCQGSYHIIRNGNFVAYFQAQSAPAVTPLSTPSSSASSLPPLLQCSSPDRTICNGLWRLSRICDRSVWRDKIRLIRKAGLGVLLCSCLLAVAMFFFVVSTKGVSIGRIGGARSTAAMPMHDPRFSAQSLSWIWNLRQGITRWDNTPAGFSSSLRTKTQWGQCADTSYVDLFGRGRSKWRNDNRGVDNIIGYHASAENRATIASAHRHRGLADQPQGDSKLTSTPKLVVAGKMTVEDGPCNIAQLDLDTGEWSLTERIQLSLYNSYSGGEVYSLLANHTFASDAPEESTDDDSVASQKTHTKSSTNEQRAGGELIVVGAFDTTYRNSQVTYCSVGKWDGSALSKVGEGLCNSALSKGMKITCAALAGPQDVYVAGSFQTQVWNGDRHEFVKIFNIAHYNAIEQVWLPLPVGQITCSWCTVTVLALAWDPIRKHLHVAGKFNAIDGSNIPAGLAIYDHNTGHLVAHPGGGLTMRNVTQDGVGTALQLDAERGLLYVMGSFERLTATGEICLGLAAYEINTHRWTCLADAAHTVLPSGGGNMLLTPHGLMVAGLTTSSTTWEDGKHPYTIALLKTTRKQTVSDTDENSSSEDDDDAFFSSEPAHDFNWSWLPGFDGHDEPLHTLSNGYGDYKGTVFIGGDNLVAKWYYEKKTITVKTTSDKEGGGIMPSRTSSSAVHTEEQTVYVPVTVNLADEHVRGAIMSISQLTPIIAVDTTTTTKNNTIGYTIIVYCVALGALIGMFLALLCNRNLTDTVMSFIFNRDAQTKGISLDTLTYSAVENASVAEAYKRAMRTRFVQHPHLLALIDPQEIMLHRIIGEGAFGRVWSGKWGSSSVAVKEFVFAQAAVAGKSSMQREIIEEIIGEAGMMAILRHPNVLQLFGCSLTAQAIWIVSELCSLGSLRQLLDNNERQLPVQLRIKLALQVAEGMSYLHNQDPPIIHRDLKSHNIFVHETFTESDSKTVSRNRKDKRKGSKERSNGESDAKQNGTSSHERYHNIEGRMDTQSTIVAKIGDWGSARAALSGSRTMTHGVGTACWLAPEVIMNARSSQYSDVYGYGIVLWELATREEVYQGLETTQIIAKVANDNLRPPVPEDCPWRDLMVQCWAEEPKARPTFEQIKTEFNRILVEAEAREESLRDLSQERLHSSSSYHNSEPNEDQGV